MNREMYPLVSIIIANYNYGRFLSTAIDSVLAQTYENFELIIVDDGSVDNSKAIMSSYGEPNIQKIFQENGGQASAFNAGYEISRGEIICFLDSDDWWKPEKLTSLVDWHKMANGEYAIIQHNLDIWFNSTVLGQYKNILPVGNCFAEMTKTRNINYFVPTSGLSFPRKILDRILPMPVEFKIAADAYLMRTAILFGDVYSIPTSLGYYRKHNNAVFNNPNFHSDEFFENLLFPKLNLFYRENNINFRLKVTETTVLKMLCKYFRRLVRGSSNLSI